MNWRNFWIGLAFLAICGLSTVMGQEPTDPNPEPLPIVPVAELTATPTSTATAAPAAPAQAAPALDAILLRVTSAQGDLLIQWNQNREGTVLIDKRRGAVQLDAVWSTTQPMGSALLRVPDHPPPYDSLERHDQLDQYRLRLVETGNWSNVIATSAWLRPIAYVPPPPTPTPTPNYQPRTWLAPVYVNGTGR